jgi:hypothetical protein
VRNRFALPVLVEEFLSHFRQKREPRGETIWYLDCRRARDYPIGSFDVTVKTGWTSGEREVRLREPSSQFARRIA